MIPGVTILSWLGFSESYPLRKGHAIRGFPRKTALARHLSVMPVHDPARDTNGEDEDMRIVRMLSLVGLVAAVLLFATGGQFHLGVLMAIGLTLLICLIEPSTAR